MIQTAVPATDRTGLGILLVVAGMFCFATMDAISKVLALDYAITQMLWVRYAVFTGFACLIAWRAGFRRTIRSARPFLQSGRALLIVVALSVPLLGEKVGLRRWLAVLAGFAGVLVIIRPGFHALEWPILIPLVGALMWGLYQIMVRLCARTDSGETTLFWSAAVGLAATTLVGPLEWRDPDAAGWTLLMALAAIASLGHFALIKGLQFAEAGAVQPFSYTLLVWATVLGVLVFGDVPDGWTVAGGAIVVGSGLYAWYRERRARRR